MTEKVKRGFASMDPKKQKEIASKGGKAAHAKGTAHEFTPDEARAAGRKHGKKAKLAAMQSRTSPGEREDQADSSQDIFSLIRSDHQQVADLFGHALHGAGEGIRPGREIYTELRLELEGHMASEEEVLYPKLESVAESTDLAEGAQRDHAEIRERLKRLEAIAAQEISDSWETALQDLKSCFEEHVRDEENEIFDKMRNVFSDEQLRQLGVEFASCKERSKKMEDRSAA